MFMYFRKHADTVCAGSLEKVKKQFAEEERNAGLETFGIIDLFQKMSAVNFVDSISTEDEYSQKQMWDYFKVEHTNLVLEDALTSADLSKWLAEVRNKEARKGLSAFDLMLPLEKGNTT